MIVHSLCVQSCGCCSPPYKSGNGRGLGVCRCGGGDLGSKLAILWGDGQHEVDGVL